MADIETLNPIQKEIYKAVKQMSERVSFTEFHIAKKIRENTKFDGKKKAGLALADMLKVFECLNEEGVFYSIHVNSVNEILIKKETEAVELPLEAKQRRQKSEKSMSIFTSGDVSAGKSKTGKSGNSHEKRSDRKKLSIYDNYDE